MKLCPIMIFTDSIDERNIQEAHYISDKARDSFMEDLSRSVGYT